VRDAPSARAACGGNFKPDLLTTQRGTAHQGRTFNEAPCPVGRYCFLDVHRRATAWSAACDAACGGRSHSDTRVGCIVSAPTTADLANLIGRTHTKKGK
jgi:hypothetical protein